MELPVVQAVVGSQGDTFWVTLGESDPTSPLPALWLPLFLKRMIAKMLHQRESSS